MVEPLGPRRSKKDAKVIVIKREHLAPEVQEAVGDLIEMRRIRKWVGGPALSSSAAVGVLPIGVHWLGGSKKSVLTAAVPFALILFSTLGGLTEANNIIARKTGHVAEKIKQHGLVKEEHEVEYNFPVLMKLRQTHPLMAVQGNGDIRLIPTSRFQEWLEKHQAKAWKHVLPFRKRERY